MAGVIDEIDWMALLRERVAQSSQGQVVREMNAKGIKISRTAISLVLAGKYPARLEKVAGHVIDAYARIDCPFLERQIPGAECRDYHTKEAPTSSPFAMRHWRACQGCPNRRPK